MLVRSEHHPVPWSTGHDYTLLLLCGMGQVNRYLTGSQSSGPIAARTSRSGALRPNLTPVGLETHTRPLDHPSSHCFTWKSRRDAAPHRPQVRVPRRSCPLHARFVPSFPLSDSCSTVRTARLDHVFNKPLIADRIRLPIRREPGKSVLCT